VYHDCGKEHVQLTQSPRKFADDFQNLSPELDERKNHRVTFSDIGLVENYLRKEWCALVHVQAHKLELMALFQHCRGTETEPFISIPLISDGRRPTNCRDISDSSQKHIVLVDGIKAMEPPERIIPSLVWVDVADYVYDFLPHALYFSGESGFTLRGRNRAVEDWELNLWRRLEAIGPNERTSEVIECAPQIMDSVANDQEQLWWDRLSLSDMDDWLRRVRIDIYRHGVGFGVEVDTKARFEVIDMFVGPFDFLSHAC
jgi:hypothetical protein